MEKCNVLIIGSGAAGYSTADWLLRFGVKDVAIATENRLSGASRNAGSDKQTYYKPSFTEPDDAKAMAKALFGGGGMHGDTAFAEAAESVRCFMRLVDYGTPFPEDDFGRFVGYRTDHDTAARGTSAGPLTSKYMTENLEAAALKRGARLLDGTAVIKIVTEKNRAVGIVALKKTGAGYEILPISANFIVLATGGAGGVYADSVYPESQHGALGLAVDAGLALNNLSEWQYGIASVSPRWNLSGSFQQVVPRYFSRDENGVEREFLTDVFGSGRAACDAIFFKGYQWPFDSRKTDGSSAIDLAVGEEIRKGRSVYMDFRADAEGFKFENLCAEAREYLEKADASGETPYERLKKLNPEAAKFFASKGVDVSKDPLKIAVCAQHMNGGVDVDVDYRTSTENIFAVGEAAGTFGVYRPGGAALNSTQVGGLRAARAIASADCKPADAEKLLSNAAEKERAYISACLESAEERTDFGRRMSSFAAHVRCFEEISELYNDILAKRRAAFYRLENGAEFAQARELFVYRDTLAAQYAVCATLLKTIPTVGSRGGAICFINGERVVENEEYRKKAVVTLGGRVEFAALRPLPETEFCFERVWQAYAAKKNNGKVNGESTEGKV